MAKLFLDTTDTSYKVSNSNTEIFGANGTQAITIDGALTGIVLDANVERVAFSGTTSDYKYKQVGTDLEVYNAAGVLVTKVGLQDDTNGTLLTFANGTVDAKFAPSTTGLGLTVGGQTVATTAPTAVTIPAANIDVVTFPITAPTLSVASVAATATEGTNAIWTVTLANPATTATTVKYTLTNVAGASNADTTDETVTGTGVTTTGSVETAPNSGIWEGTLTFAAGATTATLSLPVALDGLTETGEGVSLSLSNPSTNAIVNEAGKSATVSFVDAPATTFTLTSTAGTGVEVQEGGTITFTVTPNAAVNAATTLVLNVNGKALGAVTSTTSAADFEASPSITFAQGDTAPKTITLKVATDTAVEGREAYAVDVIDTTAYATRGNQLTGVITDKLPLLSLTQNVSTVAEGSTVTYTVTSDTPAPTGGITIPFTVAGTATSGTDYTALTASSITIAAGATTGSVTLSTIADTFTDGADETVIVTLGTAANASVSETAKTVTTTVTDSSKALGTAEMTLTGATSVNEGSTVTYTVTLGANATTALSIPYTLTGTATSGTDFTGSTGTISVAAGAKTGTLTLTTTADSITEGPETVTLTLGAVTGFTAASGQGAVTTTVNDTSISVVGSSLSLTTAVDFITGTAGNDTIVGDFTATSTFNAGDQINGGAGIDTLKMYGTYAAASMPAGITNTEILDLYISAAADLDLSSYTKAITGVTNVVLENVTLMNSHSVTTTAGQSLSLATGAGGTATAGTVTWAASAADTSANLTLNGYQGGTGVTAVALTVTGAATTVLNIASTGASNKVSTLTAPATTTSVVVTGDKGLTVTSLSGAAITKVDASAATGAVSVGVDATNATFTFLGGAGNDTVTFGTTNTFTTADSVVGGAGNDTLEMQRAQAIATTKFTNISGFETLKITNATTASDIIDLDVFGVSNINFKAASTATTTVTNIASGAILTLGATGTTALTIKNDSTSDNLKIVTSGTSQTYTVTASQFENLTIDTSAGVTGTTFALTDAQLKSLTLVNTTSTGTNPDATVDLGTLNAVISTVDLSAYKAAAAANGVTVALSGTAVNGATVTGSQNHDAITGSSQVDTIITGANGANITAGGGADTITLSASVAKTDLLTLAAAADSSQSSYDKVTGFTNSATATIADKIDFTGTGLLGVDTAQGATTGTTNLTAAVTNGFLTFAGSAAPTLTLAQAILAVTTVSNAIQNTGTAGAGVQSTVAFTFGGDTYVYSSGASNATTDDSMVQLVGLTSATSLSSTASSATAIFIA